MTPSLLAKIKKLAGDPRTDPMTRAIAQAQLDSHHGVEPAKQTIHPGLRRAPGYDEFKRANNSLRKKT